jgi:hypothetical protein
MSAKQLSNFARATRQLGLRVSMEAGGAFCGAGSGAKHGKSTVSLLAHFLQAGGHLAIVSAILSATCTAEHAQCRCCFGGRSRWWGAN